MLSKNWIIEDNIDPEYKTYRLLAYLHKVGLSFEQNQLYPHLADLVEHYKNLLDIHNGTNSIESLFPKKLKGLSENEMKFEYEQFQRDPEVMERIMEIVGLSLPLVEKQLKQGKQLYEAIENQIDIEVVGLLPIHKDNGYLLVNNGNRSAIRVYDYSITVIEHFKERFRGIRTAFVRTYNNTLRNTPEYIKLDLLRNRPRLPNPVTLTVNTDTEFPVAETLMPIAKRSIVRYLHRI